MNSDPQRVNDLLEHIVHAIDRITNYTKSDEAEFLANEMVQDAVIRNLEIIGEASRSIEKRFPEFAKENSELPLRNAYEMRNALAHGYFKTDLAIVWKTIKNDLPTFKGQIIEIQKKTSE
jgi:uncharacterized protein with HEPN domain